MSQDGFPVWDPESLPPARLPSPHSPPPFPSWVLTIIALSQDSSRKTPPSYTNTEIQHMVLAQIKHGLSTQLQTQTSISG